MYDYSNSEEVVKSISFDYLSPNSFSLSQGINNYNKKSP